MGVSKSFVDPTAKALINPEHSSGFLTETQAIEHAPAEDVVPILVKTLGFGSVAQPFAACFG